MSEHCNPVLTYDRVDISYNGRPVVQDVSFGGPGRSRRVVRIQQRQTIGPARAMGLLGQTGMVTRGDIWYSTAGAGWRLPRPGRTSKSRRASG